MCSPDFETGKAFCSSLIMFLKFDIHHRSMFPFDLLHLQGPRMKLVQPLRKAGKMSWCVLQIENILNKSDRNVSHITIIHSIRSNLAQNSIHVFEIIIGFYKLRNHTNNKGVWNYHYVFFRFPKEWFPVPLALKKRSFYSISCENLKKNHFISRQCENII